MFKVCSCCGHTWNTREDFIKTTTFIGDWKEFGLLLYNCKCNTTLSIEIYEGSKKDAVEKRRKNNAIQKRVDTRIHGVHAGIL